MMFLRQCGTYPGRDVPLLLAWPVWSAALRTRAAGRSTTDRQANYTCTYTLCLCLYLARTTYNLMDVMSCLPDLRRCATRQSYEYRAVGRCSVRMGQAPAKCFFSHSILESNGRENRQYR